MIPQFTSRSFPSQSKYRLVTLQSLYYSPIALALSTLRSSRIILGLSDVSGSFVVLLLVKIHKLIWSARLNLQYRFIQRKELSESTDTSMFYLSISSKMFISKKHFLILMVQESTQCGLKHTSSFLLQRRQGRGVIHLQHTINKRCMHSIRNFHHRKNKRDLQTFICDQRDANCFFYKLPYVHVQETKKLLFLD